MTCFYSSRLHSDTCIFAGVLALAGEPGRPACSISGRARVPSLGRGSGGGALCRGTQPRGATARVHPPPLRVQREGRMALSVPVGCLS